ncbi:AAA family ATPase [Leptolyngbya sp. PCC 6406]|uniref:AAA family ATPase n=1 Tax=Leptolyngbya sp. PCC 6406 TaxID=1173264 RepID=UPI0002AC3DA3|nr:AAA family ATPase [Leptolyngbya sp. PCC 6406]
MLTISGYEVFTLLHEGKVSQIYRGRRTSDGQAVVFKTLRGAIPDPAYLARYQQEYAITQSLSAIAGVIDVYALKRVTHRPVIVLEDYGAQTLGEYLAKGPLELEPFLEIAIAITQILGEVHSARIIHKDINPSNILVHPLTGVVKLIDFGIASQLSRETPTISGTGSFEGTLAYLSPEQTGRMNRALDYRSDFYSLGATFFQMLTGQLPFQFEDPLELIHAHIARTPPNLQSLRPEIPAPLAAIVHKLLAKTAEERYQSARGLVADLQRCRQKGAPSLDREAVGGEALEGESFILGTQDVSDRFQIPQRLYGREAEVAQILAAFARVSPPPTEAHFPVGKRELVLVSGYSGIGKSTLVREVYQPITGRRGYLIGGKFDPLQRNIPYLALINAFADLVGQLLTESDAQLEHWRSQLHQALGANLQVMAVLVPQLTLIVGDQPAPTAVSGTEAQNRFNLAIQTFIRVFAQPQHPLVMFLDDLQWADAASLALMQRLLTEPEAESLLLIGAYRDNEVDPTHPLQLTLDRIHAEGGLCSTVHLQPLDLGSITQLVADTLLCSPGEAAPLAELLQAKTGGNPFFMAEFLKTLYRDGLITFDPQQGRWQWELTAIQQRNVTDNLVELMAARLQQLPPASQRVLQYAACMGNPFDLQSLAGVLAQTLEETAAQLWPTLEAELVLPLGDTYRLTSVAALSDRPLEYRFAHDRIQQAAYSLLPEGDRAAVHHWVGHHLLTMASQEQHTTRLFPIVNQLNLGLSQVRTEEDRLILAGLNLRAGQQAKAAAAYDTALNYLRLGLDLVGEEGWQEQPNLMADLYQETAEVACLCGEYDFMTRLTATALAQVHTLERRTQLHVIQLQATILQNQPRLAVEQALGLLRPLGVKFPRRLRLLYTILGLMRTRLRLSRWSEDDLRSQPVITDPHQQAVMALLGKIGTPAYVATPDLSPLITFKILKLSLRYGYTVPTAIGFASYGLVMAGIMGDIEAGYRYGQIGLAVADRFQSPMIRCRSQFLFNYLICHWKQPLRDIVPRMESVYQLGLEAGDLEYAAFALYASMHLRLFAGEELPTLTARLTDIAITIERLQQQTARKWVRIMQAFLQCLMALPTEGQSPVAALAVPETEEGDRTGIFLAHSYRLILHYLFGQPDQALVEAEGAKPVLDAATSAPAIPVHTLFVSLSQLAWLPQAKVAQQRRVKRDIRKARQQFQRWATHAPANYEAARWLLEAEYRRSQGKVAAALKHFQQAIQAAQTHRRLSEEAIAHERIGELYLQLDQTVAAAAHLSRAHFCYQLWGAVAKATLLRRQYPHLITVGEEIGATTVRSRITTHQTATSTSSGRLLEALDFSSVMKASVAISSEIVLDQLLTRLMEILIESAGAQSGVLLLNHDGQLRADVYGTTETGTTQVVQRDADRDGHEGEGGDAATLDWPVAIVNYVMRTQESLVLDNATQDERFLQDAYIQARQPQSVLCTPLKNQGRLSGLVYLENNLAPNAFTPDRLEVLNLLSSQAAIALDNARLYTNLADLNAAYARFVPRQFLQHLNKRSITEVNLGDQVQLEMSVMFSDIRAFTTLSETLTPEENFRFINDYLARMEPVIVEHGGFIDKYIGDAIMALFSGSAADAVQGGIAMQRTLTAYNLQRQELGHAPLRIGIGINTGSLMLGTVGGPNRMDSTVISDAVNLAARLETLTKTYGVSLLISYHTYDQIRYPQKYCIRKIGLVTVQGKTQAVTVYEVFDGDPEPLRQGKLQTLADFHRGVDHYDLGQLEAAATDFKQCAAILPEDPVVQYYLLQCHQAQGHLHNLEGYGEPSPLTAG